MKAIGDVRLLEGGTMEVVGLYSSKVFRETVAKTTPLIRTTLAARRLKSIADLQNKSVDEKSRERLAKRKPTWRGLRDETPVRREIGTFIPAPARAPLAYSEKEKEHLALKVLQAAINGELSELKDYRHLRGVGADASDKTQALLRNKSVVRATTR